MLDEKYTNLISCRRKQFSHSMEIEAQDCMQQVLESSEKSGTSIGFLLSILYILWVSLEYVLEITNMRSSRHICWCGNYSSDDHYQSKKNFEKRARSLGRTKVLNIFDVSRISVVDSPFIFHECFIELQHSENTTLKCSTRKPNSRIVWNEKSYVYDLKSRKTSLKANQYKPFINLQSLKCLQPWSVLTENWNLFAEVSIDQPGPEPVFRLLVGLLPQEGVFLSCRTVAYWYHAGLWLSV